MKAELQREKGVCDMHCFQLGPLELYMYLSGVKRTASFHLMDVIFGLR